MQQCVICILDILGTKGIWTEESIDRYFEVINEIKTDLEEQKIRFVKMAGGKPLEFDFVTFSDTLILTIITKQENHEYFFEEIIEGFTQFILGIFQVYFSHRFFVRGAISYGLIEKRGEHFVGPAVDDAAEYFEQADLIGIHLTPKTSIAIEYAIDWNKKFFNRQIDNFIVRYNTPLKNKTYLHLYQINWPKHFLLEKDNERIPMSPMGELGIFMGKRNIPLSAVSKFENTFAFFNYILNSGTTK